VIMVELQRRSGSSTVFLGASQRKRMVDRAGILDSQLAGHDGMSAPRRFSCQYQDPFTAPLLYDVLDDSVDLVAVGD
jgi:hypothetical protein